MSSRNSFVLSLVSPLLPLALPLVLSTAVLGAACGGGADEATASASCGDDADARQPFVTPTLIHSGFNGRDSYQAVLQANFGTFSLTSRDASVVDVSSFGCLDSGDSGIVAVLDAVGAGETRVSLSSGDFRETIDVKIASYSTAAYDAGEERYNTPADANTTNRVACNECHREGAGGAPHSPLSLASNSDTDLLSAITTGAYPGQCEREDSGALCDCTPSGTDCSGCPESDCSFSEGYVLDMSDFGVDHEFDLTDNERTGINAYMRAIKPDGI